MTNRRLIIITGQEGAGKSTVVRALLHRTPRGAQIDAEDVGQVNPWEMNDAFKELLWRNVAGLILNFWEAGYVNVVAASFLSSHHDYLRFRPRLGDGVSIYLVQLRAAKAVRDQRRIARSKPTSKAWRDRVDRADPEDATFRGAVMDARYVHVDNSTLTLIETIDRIERAIPEVYSHAGT